MHPNITKLQSLVDNAVNVANDIFSRAAELENREEEFLKIKAEILAMLASLATTPRPHRAKCIDTFKSKIISNSNGYLVLFLEMIDTQIRLLDPEYDQGNYLDEITNIISPDTNGHEVIIKITSEEEGFSYETSAMFILLLLLAYYNFSYKHDGVFNSQ